MMIGSKDEDCARVQLPPGLVDAVTAAVVSVLVGGSQHYRC